MSYMNGTCNGTIFGVPTPRGPWVGAKRSNIIKSQLLSRFQPNYVCLLTKKRYKAYQCGFSFDRLGNAPGLGLGGTVGMGVKFFFSEIQPELMCELLTCNSTQFFGSSALGPWGGAKGQISLNLNF